MELTILIAKILIIVLSILLGGFYSGSETGMYRIAPIRLKLSPARKSRKNKVLERLLVDRQEMIFITLSGTNLSNYIATNILMSIFLFTLESKSRAELYTTAVLTPTLFIFSEVLPKNIYFANPYYFMPKSSKLLLISKYLFTYTGIIPSLNFLTKVVETLTGLSKTTQNLATTAQKHQVLEIVRQTHDEGFLGKIQADFIDSFLSISRLPCSQIATSISKFICVNVNSSRADLLKKMANSSEAVWLVYKGSRREIVGWVDLMQVANSETDFSGLKKCVNEFKTVRQSDAVIDVLDILTQHKIVLVTKPSGKAISVIKFDDLLGLI